MTLATGGGGPPSSIGPIDGGMYQVTSQLRCATVEAPGLQSRLALKSHAVPAVAHRPVWRMSQDGVRRATEAMECSHNWLAGWAVLLHSVHVNFLFCYRLGSRPRLTTPSV